MSVRAERQRVDLVPVSVEQSRRFFRAGIPQPDCAIGPRAGDLFAVLPNSQTAYRTSTSMPGQITRWRGGRALPRPRVSEHDRTVRSDRSQLSSIRAERKTFNLIVMIADRQYFTPRFRVPDLYQAISSSGGQPPTVGTEGQCVHAVEVSLEDKRFTRCR